MRIWESLHCGGAGLVRLLGSSEQRRVLCCAFEVNADLLLQGSDLCSALQVCALLQLQLAVLRLQTLELSIALQHPILLLLRAYLQLPCSLPSLSSLGRSSFQFLDRARQLLHGSVALGKLACRFLRGLLAQVEILAERLFPNGRHLFLQSLNLVLVLQCLLA